MYCLLILHFKIYVLRQRCSLASALMAVPVLILLYKDLCYQGMHNACLRHFACQQGSHTCLPFLLLPQFAGQEVHEARACSCSQEACKVQAGMPELTCSLRQNAIRLSTACQSDNTQTCYSTPGV